MIILKCCEIEEFHDSEFGFFPNRGEMIAVTLANQIN